jgi:hypothetical protein
MAWDDELEHLTTKAYETFGWGTFQAARARALAATLTRKMEPIQVAAESNQLAAWMVDNGMTNGSIAPTSALYEALRTERRQLMREH